MKKLRNYKLILRRLLLVVVDIISVYLASYFALATRFEFIPMNIPKEFIITLMYYMPGFIAISLGLFFIFRLYSSLWEYAGLEEAFNIVWACVISGVLMLGFVVITGRGLPRSFFPLVIIYQFIFLLGTRFLYRYTRMRIHRRNFPWKKKNNRVMLIGAGEAATAL